MKPNPPVQPFRSDAQIPPSYEGTPMTTKETLINCIPFPIFAADINGRIAYKNRAAIRYIGTMRKGSYVRRYFFGNEISKTETLASLSVPTPYPNVVIVADERETLFLCFSRLQYPDAKAVAPEMLRAFGKTPSQVFLTLETYYHSLKQNKKLPTRIYTELLHLFPQNRIEKHMSASMLEPMLPMLFETTKESFAPFGYRFHTEIHENFLKNAPIQLDEFDFLFLYGRFLYAMMKLSKDGAVEMTVASEGENHCHRLSFYTHTDQIPPQTQYSLGELFSEFLPECAAELFLMGYSEHLENQTSLFTDLCGTCTLEYRIPHLSPSLSLRSRSFTEDISSSFSRELFRIAVLLKGIPSSCQYFSAGNSKLLPQAEYFPDEHLLFPPS